MALLHNLDYKTVIDRLQGQPIHEQIKVYQDIYDAEIPFDEYFWNKFPDRPRVKSGPCPLHDEDMMGKSFSIDTTRNLWQCFGKCNMVGRAVQFELTYGLKTNPNLTRLGALKRLHKIYPQLPEPIIYETSKIVSSLQNNALSFDVKLYTNKDIKLNEQSEDLSVRILQAMLIDKNLNKTYRP